MLSKPIPGREIKISGKIKLEETYKNSDEIEYSLICETHCNVTDSEREPSISQSLRIPISATVYNHLKKCLDESDFERPGLRATGTLRFCVESGCIN